MGGSGTSQGNKLSYSKEAIAGSGAQASGGCHLFADDICFFSSS